MGQAVEACVDLKATLARLIARSSMLASTSNFPDDMVAVFYGAPMRRRLRKYLSVILIALMVQILAPVAIWAPFVVASDPLVSAEICHGSPDSDPWHSDQGGGADHDGVCFICCVLCASASVDPPPLATFAHPYREVRRVVWGHHLLRFFAARTGSNSQARAPPQTI